MSNSILDNMPSAERDALLSKLRDLLAPKVKTVRDVPAPDLRKYYCIQHGMHETVIDQRDAANMELALNMAAHEFLQPWYITSPLSLGFLKIKDFTHTQYIEWLRRS